MKPGLSTKLGLVWVLAVGWATVCTPLWSVAMTSEGTDSARTALNRGRADDALRLLDAALAQDPGNAEALNLRCRVYFAEERWDDAIGACERAVKLASDNSSYHMWLGRAYGEKADRVTFVTAYKMAKLIRAEFEAAARLGAKDGEALSDLGQYYVEAPAILGGGYSRAEAVAQQMDGFAPVRAHDLRARIAEAKKDYAGAEKEFRAKISASHSEAQSWMDLGSFYRRRERWDEMLAAVESGAVAAERDHGPALVDGASTLMDAGRKPESAIEWLRQYLSGDALSEDAPAFAVHVQLGRLLKGQGNTQEAEREFAAARALAKDYVVAKGPKTNTGR